MLPESDDAPKGIDFACFWKATSFPHTCLDAHVAKIFTQ